MVLLFMFLPIKIPSVRILPSINILNGIILNKKYSEKSPFHSTIYGLGIVFAISKNFIYCQPQGLIINNGAEIPSVIKYFAKGFLFKNSPIAYIAKSPSPDTTPPWILFQSTIIGGIINNSLLFPVFRTFSNI